VRASAYVWVVCDAHRGSSEGEDRTPRGVVCKGEESLLAESHERTTRRLVRPHCPLSRKRPAAAAGLKSGAG
jgi:hypothetical protein